MSDVICLSSDDEFQPKKKTNNSNATKNLDKSSKNVQAKKRKASAYVGFVPLSKKRVQTTLISKTEVAASSSSKDGGIEVLDVVPESSAKVNSSMNKSTSKNAAKLVYEDWNRPSTSKQSMNPSSTPKASSKIRTLDENGKNTDAPQLVIKEKRPVVNNHPGSEVFAQFLSQCLSRERSPAMEKIVEKLKRHYDQLDPDYARSSSFIDLLNEKREFLMVDDNRLYIHISDVDKEMKCRKRIAPVVTIEASRTVEGAEEPENKVVDPRIDHKVKKILLVMEKCQERIKQLDEAELDWDDDNNSNYIKVMRYKERMMQLYYKYCELTGEHEDAGRSYLRPKYLRVTKIPSVDQAIVSFINKKLTDKVKRTKKGQSAAECVIFPDYLDILSCIQKCNDEKKMGMSKSKTEELAKNGFQELGNYLQRVRQQDFLDTFSMIDVGGEDPAIKDPEIAAKLKQSAIEGKKRMDELLAHFSRRQEERTSKADDDGSDGDEKSDEDDEDTETNGSNDIEDLENVCGDKFDKDIGKDDAHVDVDGEEASLDAEGEEASLDAAGEEASLDAAEGQDSDEIGKEDNNDDELSDSKETVILSPTKIERQPHRVVGTFAGTVGQSNRQIWETEGTVTIDKAVVQYEQEEKLRKNQKAESKGLKSPVKPTITNIQNVKVVIRAHEIVDINEKLRTKEILNNGECDIAEKIEEVVEEKTKTTDDDSEICKKTDAVKAEADETPRKSAEINEKAECEESDVMIVSDGNTSFETCPEASPETADVGDNKNDTLKIEKVTEAETKTQDCAESQESIVIIDEIVKDIKPVATEQLTLDQKPSNLKRISPIKLSSSIPKVCKTNSSINTIVKSISPVKPTAQNLIIETQINSSIGLQSSSNGEKNNEIISSTTIIDKSNDNNETREKMNEVSAIVKTVVDGKDENSENKNSMDESSLKLNEDEAVKNAEAVIGGSSAEIVDEKKPILKVRSFAKPPEYWTSPPQNKIELPPKVIKKSSKPIELVDLDEDDGGKLNSISTCQSKTTDKSLITAGNKKTPGSVRVVITLPSNKLHNKKINVINEENYSSISFNVGSIASGTSSSPSPSTKPRPTGLIKIATVNPTTSTTRLVGQVKPMKNNTVVIARNTKAVIIPYNRVKPTSQPPAQQNQRNYSFPIKNATAGLSSIIKDAKNNSASSNIVKTAINNVNDKQLPGDVKKTMCINPVNRVVLTKVPQRVVNPVAKINLSQKEVSSDDKSRDNES